MDWYLKSLAAGAGALWEWRAAAALLLVSLASCDGAGDTVPERNEAAKPAPAQSASRGDAFAPGEPASIEAKGAADVARDYFGHITARRYDDAWRLRWRSGDDDRAGFAAFVANFERYDSYNAQVGPPRPAQEAEDSVFVDVPVQLYGRLKNGEGFGSAGMVTLRRKLGGPESSWLIYS